MKTLLAALVLAAAPAAALDATQRVNAIAASAGLVLPVPAEPLVFAPVKAVRVPVRVAVSADAVGSGSAYGSGFVNGSGWLHCSSRDNHPGWFSGFVNLDGDVRVTGPDGTAGNVRVSGMISVSGSCSNGGGFANGSGTVSGSGYLYKDGRSVGRADMSGHVFLNRYVSGYAYFSEYVSLNGYFRAD